MKPAPHAFLMRPVRWCLMRACHIAIVVLVLPVLISTIAFLVSGAVVLIGVGLGVIVSALLVGMVAAAIVLIVIGIVQALPSVRSQTEVVE